MAARRGAWSPFLGQSSKSPAPAPAAPRPPRRPPRPQPKRPSARAAASAAWAAAAAAAPSKRQRAARHPEADGCVMVAAGAACCAACLAHGMPMACQVSCLAGWRTLWLCTPSLVESPPLLEQQQWLRSLAALKVPRLLCERACTCFELLLSRGAATGRSRSRDGTGPS